MHLQNIPLFKNVNKIDFKRIGSGPAPHYHNNHILVTAEAAA